MQIDSTLASGAATAAAVPQKPPRNVAIDAYRGLVMLLMMGEVLEFARVSQNFPGNWFWSFLAYHQTHTQWAGCSLHDTIQPSFTFLVGVALPYSIASRMAQRREVWPDAGARRVARAAAGVAGHLPAVALRAYRQFHV